MAVGVETRAPLKNVFTSSILMANIVAGNPRINRHGQLKLGTSVDAGDGEGEELVSVSVRLTEPRIRLRIAPVMRIDTGN